MAKLRPSLVLLHFFLPAVHGSPSLTDHLLRELGRAGRQTVRVCHIWKKTIFYPSSYPVLFSSSTPPTLLCLSGAKESNLKREYWHQSFHQRHVLCLEDSNKHSCWFQGEHDSVAQNLEGFRGFFVCLFSANNNKAISRKDRVVQCS